MELTEVHRTLLHKAKRFIFEKGDVTLKDFSMDTEDFYTHFPGGIKQLKEHLPLDVREK
jgi:hypothetical protein